MLVATCPRNLRRELILESFLHHKLLELAVGHDVDVQGYRVMFKARAVGEMRHAAARLLAGAAEKLQFAERFEGGANILQSGGAEVFVPRYARCLRRPLRA